MNLNKFMKTGALVAMMALGVVGCNENPTDTPSTIGNVGSLEAVSLSSNSVGLKWNASSTVGATYLVSYRKVGSVVASDSASSAAGSGSGIIVTGNTATIGGLTQGEYKFFVHTMSGTQMSTGATINWAPADRITNDAATPSVTLRMYEVSSTSGSGLVLDPALLGPKNARVRKGSATDPRDVALAIYNRDTTGGPLQYTDSFDIGPAYALVGFANADNFDTTSYISKDGYPVMSLNELYLPGSIENYITPGGPTAGNISAFRLPNVRQDGKGVAFLMRVGNNNNRRYLRILIKNVGGKLLQGPVDNRYVEVEISLQRVANLPYAKGIVRAETPAGYHSHQQFVNGR